MPGQENVKNYRPMSLLNTDHKILSKVLTAKLKTVMELLIHENQQCATPGGKIHNHLHNTREIISHSKEKQIKGLIFSLDQEKVFNRTNHQFLHTILEEINVGQHTREWLKILYSKATSHIITNQELSKEFTIERSVRQGCSLSSLLYVITLELFLEEIQQNKTIKRIPIPGHKEDLKPTPTMQCFFFTELR